MSRRRDILDSIAARLAAIDGIITVAPWQKNFSSNRLPAIAWRDKVEKLDRQEFGRLSYRLTVVYAGYVKGGASAARDLLLQILTAIGDDPRHDNNARSSNLISAEIGLQVADATISGCRAEIEIVYATPPDATGETNRLQDENQNNLTDENGDNLTW